MVTQTFIPLVLLFFIAVMSLYVSGHASEENAILAFVLLLWNAFCSAMSMLSTILVAWAAAHYLGLMPSWPR